MSLRPVGILGGSVPRLPLAFFEALARRYSPSINLYRRGVKSPTFHSISQVLRRQHRRVTGPCYTSCAELTVIVVYPLLHAMHFKVGKYIASATTLVSSYSQYSSEVHWLLSHHYACHLYPASRVTYGLQDAVGSIRACHTFSHATAITGY